MSNTRLAGIKDCLVCGGQLAIREMCCAECGLTLRGEFGVAGSGGALAAAGTDETARPASRFDALSPEQSLFLETFLRCRGVIRDMEAALGLSYPTVRARLDTLLAALDLAGGPGAAPAAPPSPPAAASEAPPAPAKPSISDLLSQIDSGALGADAALDALRDGKSAR